MKNGEKKRVGGKTKKKVDYIKKLDTVFSQYIRLKYSDNNGYCRCISCGRLHYWKDIQNGHYMSRRYMATRFSENNCRPQCVACNIYNQGNAQMYRRGLISQIGENNVDIIEMQARTGIKKYSDFELEVLIKHYQKEIENLKEEKHIK